MTEAPRHNSKWTFSLATMLLVITIACLATALILTNRRLTRLERRQLSHDPLTLEEVVTQFEKQTTLAPISTEVIDVRYSEEKDAYKVRFSWTNSTTQKTWTTDIILESDDYGAYLGKIRSRPFVEPLGATYGFPIVVQSASKIQR